ncbi:MAG: PSP1 domain-containing protein, partial [Gemmatimonadota bacterium]
MAGFAEVRFKGTRKDYFTFRGLDLRPGAHVIVEADRGEDLGEVTALGTLAERKCASSDGGCPSPAPDRRVLRMAEPPEVNRLDELRTDEERVRAETSVLVARHGLKMKVTEAEWQFDRKKLIIYFTAERRVDFRELVRDLARAFRTRIELKQIGVRDEAALLGGVGRCGRELCCSTWLPELK